MLTLEQWKALVLIAHPNAVFEQHEDPEPEFQDDWMAYVEPGGPTCSTIHIVGCWTTLINNPEAPEWHVGDVGMADRVLFPWETKVPKEK